MRNKKHKRPLLGWSAARRYEWVGDQEARKRQHYRNALEARGKAEYRIVSKYMPNQGGGQYVATRDRHGRRLYTKAVKNFVAEMQRQGLKLRAS